MSTKNGLINTALIAVCVLAWFALPMSVFSENHATATILLKVIGSICGVFGIWRFYTAFKNQ